MNVIVVFVPCIYRVLFLFKRLFLLLLFLLLLFLLLLALHFKQLARMLIVDITLLVIAHISSQQMPL